jgi:hypothetical protein
MARPDSPILNRLDKANDGRSAITGEVSGRGYLGSLRAEHPVVFRKPAHQTLPRLPEKDTKECYAYKTGPSSHRLFLKSEIDGNKS